MFLSSPITHRLVAIARVCSGMNMLELALDGLNWSMFLPQWEIMHQQKLWSDKVAFGSRKVAVGSGKVARSVFSSVYGLHTSRKRHCKFQQNTIKRHSRYRKLRIYTFQARKCGLCYCPVLLSNGSFAV